MTERSAPAPDRSRPSRRSRALATAGAVRAGGPLAVAAVAALLAVAPVAAQQPSGDGLTVYMQNTALVRSERARPLAAGEQTVRVDGLPGQLRDGTLLVRDDAVELLAVHGRRSYRSGGSGDGVSLALDLRADRPRDRLRLAYLTGGLSWSASYAMVVAADDAGARVDGYATITNQSGTSFEDASVQLVAGTVQTGGDGGARFRDARIAAARFQAEAAAAPTPERQAFAGYHLYDLEAPTTLEAGSSRRIRLLGADAVPVTREHVLPGQIQVYGRTEEPSRREAIIRYRIERPEGTDFAETPLPTGTVRVFRPDEQGRLQLLGVDGIPNTPAGEEVVVTVGRAFDVGGTRTQTDYQRTGDGDHESAWRVELVNRTDEEVVVQVIEQVDGDWEILSSSHEARRLSAHRVRFDVPVPADGGAELTYRVRVDR